MFRRLSLAVMMLSASPVWAETDEINPVPARVLIDQAYAGDIAPSKIRFINVRNRPVRILWISFSGSAFPYAELAPVREIIQATYVANRWLVEDAGDGQPLAAFISTRSADRDNGASQIALIR